MSLPLRVEVDADGMLGRQFSELERSQLPFAVMQASNAVAFELRNTWKATAQRVFDRPTPFTVNAVQYRKATKARPFAEVYIRDEAAKGTPPSKYLLPQVEGGARRPKGMEALLRSSGIGGGASLPAGMFAVPGKGVQLDAFGNVPAGQVRQILSQLQAGREAGYVSNESEASRGRRRRRQAKKGTRGGNYFVLNKKRGRLLPGIYERLATGFGSAVRSIFVFVRAPRYRQRFDIYGLAQRQWNRLMPFHFNRELAKAIASARFRGRG
ncbi:hypothetical protein [uncultured Luteimonas sp.]|uniref:hypothetical protein n=1 Tax=uncultured Luteimonas sp. TaxID=453144 RepID=UPI00262086FF|nr:hypothetical protein [uncultured Luteimonas sp.]